MDRLLALVVRALTLSGQRTLLYMPKVGLMGLMSRVFRTRRVCEGFRVAEEAMALWSQAFAFKAQEQITHTLQEAPLPRPILSCCDVVMPSPDPNVHPLSLACSLQPLAARLFSRQQSSAKLRQRCKIPRAFARALRRWGFLRFHRQEPVITLHIIPCPPEVCTDTLNLFRIHQRESRCCAERGHTPCDTFP
mgnify:CR=1 FL=1